MDPDPDFPERLETDPVFPERLYPDCRSVVVCSLHVVYTKTFLSFSNNLQK